MRIAGGVLLIIVAVINLAVGIGYLTGGAIAGGAGKLGASMTQLAEESARKQGKEMTAEEKAQLEQSKAKMEEFSAQAGFEGRHAHGTSARSCSSRWARRSPARCSCSAAKARCSSWSPPPWCMVAEIIGAVVLKFGVMNVPGIVAAVLAFLGARSIGEAGRRARGLAGADVSRYHKHHLRGSRACSSAYRGTGPP